MVYQGASLVEPTRLFWLPNQAYQTLYYWCAKILVTQGILGKPGKFGYSKNQENQALTRLLKFYMNQAYQARTICVKSMVNQGIPGKHGKPGYYSNQEGKPDFNQALEILNKPGLNHMYKTPG